MRISTHPTSLTHSGGPRKPPAEPVASQGDSFQAAVSFPHLAELWKGGSAGEVQVALISSPDEAVHLAGVVSNAPGAPELPSVPAQGAAKLWGRPAGIQVALLATEHELPHLAGIITGLPAERLNSADLASSSPAAGATSLGWGNNSGEQVRVGLVASDSESTHLAGIIAGPAFGRPQS